MLYKNSITSTSTMVAIYPPRRILEPLKPHFSQKVWDNGPHITLAYLDKTNRGQYIDLAICLAKVAPKLEPIELSVEGAGCFRGDDAKVKLALVNGVGLDRWSLEIRDVLDKEGLLPPENHGFLPHMTLSYEKGSLGESWERPILDQVDTWECDSFYLNRGHESRTEYEIR